MDTGYDLLGDTMIITIDRELDHHNADHIRLLADKYIYSSKVKNVIFDFENTEFMDSSGIGVIMGRYRLVKTLGGRISVINVGKSVDRILLLSGLYKIVKRYENLEKAMEESKKPQKL